MVSFKECLVSNASRSLLTGLYFSTELIQKFNKIIINDKRSIERIRILNDKYNNPWSLSKIEDELLLHLSTYAEAEILNKNKILIRHPYQEEAEFILYRINLAKPIPVFIIFESLLPKRIRQELIDLKKFDINEFNRTVTNVLKRLYEAIDYEYFHISGISGKIYWRFLP
jgi:hypothetical protein